MNKKCFKQRFVTILNFILIMILIFRLPSTIVNPAPFSFIYLNFGYGVQIHFSLEYSVFNQHKLVDGENT